MQYFFILGIALSFNCVIMILSRGDKHRQNKRERATQNALQGKTKMKKYNWYRFIFADGYFAICRGMSKNELAHEEHKHGKLVAKVFECNA